MAIRPDVGSLVSFPNALATSSISRPLLSANSVMLTERRSKLAPAATPAFTSAVNVPAAAEKVIPALAAALLTISILSAVRPAVLPESTSVLLKSESCELLRYQEYSISPAVTATAASATLNGVINPRARPRFSAASEALLKLSASSPALSLASSVDFCTSPLKPKSASRSA